MYDCETVKSPVTETTFECSQNREQIKLSISRSNVSYELTVHHDKEPALIIADSQPLPRLNDKAAYDKAETGWYFGPGCFYGCDKIKTVNIRIPMGANPHVVRIKK